MNADGSEVQPVANTEGRATAPRWSPDGKSLYFPLSRKVDYGIDCQIFVAPTSPQSQPLRGPRNSCSSGVTLPALGEIRRNLGALRI